MGDERRSRTTQRRSVLGDGGLLIELEKRGGWSRPSPKEIAIVYPERASSIAHRMPRAGAEVCKL